ncbi:site-specific DNA-methyltransferase [Oceanisphaera pacifica]|uniref:site-specific DNA-methyltransferase (adenine-specific) n=1 Tax=Oceanisphaera pacifica TaxID=2818389 RepID=A0ABS3NBX2_9GAMM|nr:site-specific DNA-methyltransferase [Oceanisphaera pacifica]MBO1518099.1 site-specific DNA-methyltransferase [Oceanisphaera pacifica]
MTIKKQKLELTWIGKDKRPRLEPRIFLEDKSLSYQTAPENQAAEALFADDEQQPKVSHDNLLIHGDNLLALKALEQQYAGKVKCVFIDPPYNTGSAFTHYDDGLEHSMWLSMMRVRLELLRTLMSDDGSIWITIDDNEAHYLKVLCDEIFGRSNFISTIIWEKDAGRKNDTTISTSHDYIFLYAKASAGWKKVRNLLPHGEEQLKRYKNPDDDPRGPWRQGADGTAKSGNDSLRYEITLPSGRVVTPPSGNFWRFSKSTFEQALQENRVYFGKKGDGLPVIKKYISEVQGGMVPKTWWPSSETGSNQSARRDHLRKLLPDIEPFSTPKPEQLLERIIHIATNPGELVLDSFAGSGTTGAVAHKMGRRWIMVELGEQSEYYIVPRLKKVVDGEDQGGVSKAVNWQGGGGFRYLNLAPSLLKKDSWGNWIINKEYNGEMLAEAMCKHMGFTYAPSQTQFWNHGYSTETDYIYVTTGSLAYGQLKRISEEVGPERTLLICCKAFMTDGAEFANLTLKKIPRAILNKCEWDHDDYSFTLNVLPEELAEQATTSTEEE